MIGVAQKRAYLGYGSYGGNVELVLGWFGSAGLPGEALLWYLVKTGSPTPGPDPDGYVMRCGDSGGDCRGDRGGDDGGDCGSGPVDM